MSNDLLDQFIAEGRDLLDAASSGLLTLERQPHDGDLVNTVFRAVHTLKGASGLVDCAPLTRLLHVGEDVLSLVRSDRLELSADIVDDLLASMDQVGTWLTDLEHTGALPAEADDVSAPTRQKLRSRIPANQSDVAPPKDGAQATGETDGTADRPWLDEFNETDRLEALAAHLAHGSALRAVRYCPNANCFFAGDDPLHTVGRVPDRIAVQAFATERWPEPNVFDPFVCNLRFSVLTFASAETLEEIFEYVRDEVEIVLLRAEEMVRPRGALSDAPACQTFASQIGEAFEAGDVEAARNLALCLLERTPQEAREAMGLRALLRVLAAGVEHRPLARALSDAIGAGMPDAWWLPCPQPAEAPQGTLPGQESAEALPPTAPPSDPEPADPAAVAPVPAAASPAPRRADGPAAGAGRTVLRVDQARIDHIMSLVGELIVAKNGLPYLARRADEVYGSRQMAREIKDQHAVIDRITQDLQVSIMAVRMLPVSHVFQRFPRLVRDLSRRLGKEIELDMTGEDTEADKIVIENLADPLVHIVRNAIDHGIEPPEVREAAGKPRGGTIHLSAFQEADRVVIEIADDGAGIDVERVRRKALEKGIADPSRLEAMSDAEVGNLIFAPGFSTRDEVSDLSGRGVGMDVVRSAVEKAGGSVALASERGRGSRIRLSLPLTMAVTRAMTVACRGQIYGVPMNLISETVRVAASDVKRIGRDKVITLREAIIPILHLDELLGIATPGSDAVGEAEDHAIMVISVADRHLAVVVDSFCDVMEVIVEPIDGTIRCLSGYTGTTILGDGTVIMILDLLELLQCQ